MSKVYYHLIILLLIFNLTFSADVLDVDDSEDVELFVAKDVNPVEDSLAMFPRSSETRQPITLDGVWNFRTTDYSLRYDYGFIHHWYNQSLNLIDENYERMPVPSSFNDITENRYIRDYVGWTWYDRKFFLPSTFKQDDQTDIILRFGSVNYKCSVWLNGKHVLNHTGGHLPFQTIVTGFLFPNKENHISVAVNNELSQKTLPQGTYKIKNDTRRSGNVIKFIESDFGFDFFNYAGIQRSVWLYLVPKIRITDITLITDIIDQTNGLIHFNISTNDEQNSLILIVDVYDRQGNLVADSKGPFNGNILIKDAHFWWPFTMHPEPGYQYQLSLSLYDGDKLLDRYYQNVGIRTVRVEQQNFLVNGRPFYFRGFGKHEEYDVRGRSQDQVMIMKDFNLIKWIGANSFRTSHYPYSEQLMDEADEQGIVVIDECPAVGLKSFDRILLKQHLQTIREMITRDKNRPSVFMWSLSNEAVSSKPEAEAYYQKVSSLARQMDQSKRPITAATNQYHQDYLPPVLDVIMINRYYGWYIDNGYPQVIQDGLTKDFTTIWEKFNKPVMISEYGADTISGLHTEPSMVFTEDYQAELMLESHKAFDRLRSNGFFIGEHIWNFADFMTQQTTTRVGGNKKGIFTRQRQPKASARILRCRYWTLANVTYNEPHRQGFSYCPQIQYF